MTAPCTAFNHCPIGEPGAPGLPGSFTDDLGRIAHRVYDKETGRLRALFAFEVDARDFMVSILPREAQLK